MKKDTSLRGVELAASIAAGINLSVKSGRVFTSKSIRDEAIRFHSTGCFGLDFAISKGRGIPKAKLVEVFGPEGCGKSHLLFHFAKQVQSHNKVAVIVDIENRYSTEYLVDEIGLDPELLVLWKVITMEAAFEEIIKSSFINNKHVGVIGLDSIAAIITEREMEGEMGDANIGAQARLVTRFVSRVTKVQTDLDAPTIFAVNQLRDNVGVMYGPEYKVPGGRAMKFLGSVRAKLKRTGFIGDSDDPTGQKVQIDLVKNSVGMPNKSVELELIFGKGYSNISIMEEKFFTGKRKIEFQLNEMPYTMTKKEFENWMFVQPRKAERLFKQLLNPSNETDSIEKNGQDQASVEIPSEEVE